LSDHELDAVTGAYVGKLFLEGKATVYGTTEQAIVMPTQQTRSTQKILSPAAYYACEARR